MRGNDPQLFKLGQLQRLFGGGDAHYHVVDADAVRVLYESQAAGRIRLRVAIYEESIDFGSCKRGGKVDGSRSLTDATLLIGDRDDASHR